MGEEKWIQMKGWMMETEGGWEADAEGGGGMGGEG